MGVKMKAPGESKLNDSPNYFWLFLLVPHFLTGLDSLVEGGPSMWWQGGGGGSVVGMLKVLSGGPTFEFFSLPLDRFVFYGRKFNSFMSCKCSDSC